MAVGVEGYAKSNKVTLRIFVVEALTTMKFITVVFLSIINKRFIFWSNDLSAVNITGSIQAVQTNVITPDNILLRIKVDIVISAYCDNLFAVNVTGTIFVFPKFVFLRNEEVTLTRNVSTKNFFTYIKRYTIISPIERYYCVTVDVFGAKVSSFISLIPFKTVFLSF